MQTASFSNSHILPAVKITIFCSVNHSLVNTLLVDPMVGLMGIDWAYGFDYVTTSQSGARSRGGSNFHFILGQEF